MSRKTSDFGKCPECGAMLECVDSRPGNGYRRRRWAHLSTNCDYRLTTKEIPADKLEALERTARSAQKIIDAVTGAVLESETVFVNEIIDEDFWIGKADNDTCTLKGTRVIYEDGRSEPLADGVYTVREVKAMLGLAGGDNSQKRCRPVEERSRDARGRYAEGLYAQGVEK